MNMVVLVKQIPDPEAFVAIGRDGVSLDIEQKFAMNLFDEFAIEEALRIKAKHAGKVKVITLGSGKAVEALRTGIAMGEDEALLLEDEAFLDGDGYATALVLSRAIAKEPISGHDILDFVSATILTATFKSYYFNKCRSELTYL